MNPHLTDTTVIRPIETVYRGFRFRSRLEARWAVFLDHLEIPFEYEPEGFHTPLGPYLPDFYLPNQFTYLEIKPFIKGAQLERALDLLDAICVADTGLLISGSPGLAVTDYFLFSSKPTLLSSVDGRKVYGREPGWFGGAFGDGGPVLCWQGKSPTGNPSIEAALIAARQARFEHGARPWRH